MNRKWLRIFVNMGLVALLLSCSGGRKAPVAPVEQVVGDRLPATEEADISPLVSLDRTLAELDALPLPEGVEAAVFAELKGALREALSAKDSPKFVSKPPTGEANRVDDLAITDNGDGTFTLTWSYRNVGDYDQNGIVNISDLTPLAVHFNENADAPNEWIDGNGDTVIDIKDVTPLAAHFLTGCAGYLIEESGFSEGPYTQFDSTSFASATGEGRMQFRVQLSASPGTWLRVICVDGADAKGLPSNAVRVPTTPGNLRPVADVSPTQIYGNAPLMADFDASGSYDPDGGTIVRFEWDWEGNGTYDYDSGAEANVSNEFDAGTFATTVRVTDDEGSKDTATATIIVNAPPVAVITADVLGGELPLPVHFTSLESSDADGTIMVYLWDFDGDGEWDDDDTTPTSRHHTYSEPGVYTAVLLVGDNDGGQDSDSVEITVTAPPNQGPSASFSATPSFGPPPLEVDFDASGSADPDGTIVSYDWDLDGDSTYEEQTTEPAASHTYENEGKYKVRLRVTDDDGIMAEAWLVVAVIEAPFRGDWWMFGREPTHSRNSPFTGPDTPTLLWRHDMKVRVESSPVLGVDGTVYVGSGDWVIPPFTGEGYLYAIWPDGRLRWKFPVLPRACVEPTPAVAEDGTVYIADWDGVLYALNPDGTVKWQFEGESPHPVFSSPAIGADGSVYFASGSTESGAYVYALDVDGSLRWRFPTGGLMWHSSPAIDHYGTVYIGGYEDGILYAITSLGTEAWKYETEGAIESTPAVASDGTVYVGSIDNYFYAVKADGSLDWRYETDGRVLSSPAVALDGTVYVGSCDNHLYAFNPDGSVRWRFQADDFVTSSPSIDADGTIYFGSYDGKLYALNPDGTLKWDYQTGDVVESSVAIGSDGSIYVGSWDGYLYAFGN